MTWCVHRRWNAGCEECGTGVSQLRAEVVERAARCGNLEGQLEAMRAEVDQLRAQLQRAVAGLRKVPAYTKHGHPCADDCIKCYALALLADLEGSAR